MVKAQPPAPQSAEIHLERTQTAITLDGKLEEAVWQGPPAADSFSQNFPNDGSPAEAPTQVWLTYDEENLYVAVVCYTPTGEFIVNSLRRDFGFGSNDNFGVYLDPFNDKNNGFLFAVNPFGVQREGLIANGNDVATDWDNKWQVAAQQYEDRWTAEFVIPFRALRYNPENRVWNINFLRNNLSSNERTSWIHVPQGYRLSSLVFTGQMHWPEPPPKAKSIVSLIPYVLAGGLQDSDVEGGAWQGNFNAGMDAKIAVTSSLNLDLTVLPDFSQVEVDQQVTNLSRFQLFFPERRQFFLENSDLFASFGFRNIRPFYSRRIGLDAPVITGARLSGKVNRNWRVGLLNVQTGEVTEDTLPATNYTVASFQRQIFARSQLSAIFVNKQATQAIEVDSGQLERPYNRVAGVDYSLRSADDTWTGKFFYLHSFDSDGGNQNFAHAAFLGYNTKNWFLGWNHELIGEDFNAETGFIRRNGVMRLEPFARYSFFPTQGPIQRHGPRLRMDWYTDSPFSFQTTLDRSFGLEYRFDMLNTASGEAEITYDYVLLFDDLDPSQSGEDSVRMLPEGSDYRYYRVRANWRTDSRRDWRLEGSVETGGYFNGHRTEVRGEFNYRFRPFGSLSVRSNFNRIQLPEGFNSVDYWLIAPRLEVTFTRSIFWTTVVQYNTQGQSFGLNTRLQWRFAPVSDLFIVYSDNYMADPSQPWIPKNRGLIVKLNYWLNI